MPTGFQVGWTPGRNIGVQAGTVDALFRQILFLSAGRPVFTADYYILDPSSQKILAFVDWNDPTHLLIQTSSAAQVRVPTRNAAGVWEVAFTGAQVYASNRSIVSWNFFHNGPCEWATQLTLTGGAGTTRMIAETTDPGATGGSQYFLTSSNNFRHNVIRTSSSAALDVSAAAIGTPQLFTGIVDTGQTPNRSVKRTGTTAVTAALGGTDKDATLAFTFGGRTASLFLQATTPALFIGSRGLSTAQRASRDLALQTIYKSAA